MLPNILNNEVFFCLAFKLCDSLDFVNFDSSFQIAIAGLNFRFKLTIDLNFEKFLNWSM